MKNNIEKSIKVCPECKQQCPVKARICRDCGYPFFGLHTPWRIRILDICVGIMLIGFFVLEYFGLTPYKDSGQSFGYGIYGFYIILLGVMSYITIRIWWWERFRQPKRPKRER